MGMFIAATDNTGVAMGMVLYCLVKFPKETEKVVEEIEKILPGDPDLLNNIPYD